MNLAKRSHSRSGFTLIEMLVVIAIIVVLIALVVPAVMSFTKKGEPLQTSSEMAQLDTAILNFKQTYKVDYIPSYLRLCERYTDYDLQLLPNGQPRTPRDAESVAYLLRVWPHLLDPGAPWASGGTIDWNGNGKGDAATTLEGDQCLVFFLGGIPVGLPTGVPAGSLNLRAGTAGCIGFSTDPRDPSKALNLPGNPAQTTGRKGPFFDGFTSDRLILRGGPANTAFYSFVDPYKKGVPYAYFSNYGTRNGYNKFGTVDCAGLGVGFGNNGFGNNGAYFETGSNPLRFYNPSSHQIISAGADGVFGPGGPWTQGAVGTTQAKDDQCNFYGLVMGN